MRAFDEGLAPARAGGEARAAAALPLSEFIEREVRGQARADAAASTPRWTAALPGDPPPLCLSAIRGAGTAAEKIAALEAANVSVARSPSQVPELLRAAMAG